MRGDRLEPRRDREARRVGIHDQRRNSLGARRLAGAREDHVMVGDAAVRDPGFAAVEHEDVALATRAGRDARGIGARLGLGQRKAADRLAGRDRRQIARLLRFGAEQRDRPRAQTLHGEGEVGEAGAVGQQLAGEAEAADIEPGGAPAVRGDDRKPEQPRVAQRPDQPAAAAVDILLVDQAVQCPVGEALDLIGQRPMRGLEERPVEEAAIGHQSPSNTGFCFAAKASYARRKSADRHTDRLRLGLGLERLIEAHVPLLVQHALGHGMREGRAGGELGGERAGLGEHRLGRRRGG